MTEQAEIDEAARRLLHDAARTEEVQYLEVARAKGYADAFIRMKRGLKVQAFLDSPLGKIFCDKAAQTISEACEIWITIDDPDAVRIALINARAAMQSLNTFSEVLSDAKDAERQLDDIEREVGSTDFDG